MFCKNESLKIKKAKQTTVFLTIVMGVCISIGIYFLTKNVVATIFLGIGITMFIGYIFFGLVLTTIRLKELKELQSN